MSPSLITSSGPRTKWGIAVLFGVLGSLIVALVVLAFMWPAKTSTPHNLPVSVAGPEQAVTALKGVLDGAAPGTIDVVAATDRDEAVRQIESRETYGAIVLAAPPAAPEVLTAPAGSAVATQMLTGMAAQLQAQASQQVAKAGGDPASVTVKVTPIVPLSDSDPTGAGLAAASFPMTIGGMIGGVLISLLVVGGARRLAALGAYAVAAGLVLAAVLQPWFGFLQGNFGLNALALGLSILATASFIVGCASLLGNPGIGLAAVITILFASPLAGAAAPWQFIPSPWGAIGQYFVPGASNWLIRSLSYFPGADAGAHWWILIAWTAAGALLTLVGGLGSRTAMTVPASTLVAGPGVAAATVTTA